MSDFGDGLLGLSFYDWCWAISHIRSNGINKKVPQQPASCTDVAIFGFSTEEMFTICEKLDSDSDYLLYIPSDPYVCNIWQHLPSIYPIHVSIYTIHGSYGIWLFGWENDFPSTQPIGLLRFSSKCFKGKSTDFSLKQWTSKFRYSNLAKDSAQALLVGGLEHFLFSHILGIIIPID